MFDGVRGGGEIMTLNDVLLCFGIHKRDLDEQVTALSVGKRYDSCEIS